MQMSRIKRLAELAAAVLDTPPETIQRFREITE